MIESSRLSIYEDQVNDRLTLERSIDKPSGVSEVPEPIADSPNPDREIQSLRLDDSRESTYNQQRTRSSNLPATRPSDNYRALLDPIADRNPATTRPKVTNTSKPAAKAYVVLPDSLFGIKLSEGSASGITQGIKGASVGASIGSAVPVIGNIVGGVVGAIGGFGAKIFGIGQSKDIWFDVVYKDALQQAFEGLGFPTIEPYDGKLTQRSQFHIKKAISISDMKAIIREFNNSIAAEFAGNPKIVNGLAAVTVENSYNKTRTAFSFTVLNEQKAQRPKQNGESGSGSNAKSAGGNSGVKSALGIASVIGILLSLRG